MVDEEQTPLEEPAHQEDSKQASRIGQWRKLKIVIINKISILAMLSRLLCLIRINLRKRLCLKLLLRQLLIRH